MLSDIDMFDSEISKHSIDLNYTPLNRKHPGGCLNLIIMNMSRMMLIIIVLIISVIIIVWSRPIRSVGVAATTILIPFVSNQHLVIVIIFISNIINYNHPSCSIPFHTLGQGAIPICILFYTICLTKTFFIIFHVIHWCYTNIKTSFIYSVFYSIFYI